MKTSGSSMMVDERASVDMARHVKAAFGSRAEESVNIPLGDIEVFMAFRAIKGPATNFLINIITDMLGYIDMKGSHVMHAAQSNTGEDTCIARDISINHPTHYKLNDRECINEMLVLFGPEMVRTFCTLNAWKYRYRAGAKQSESSASDLAKADRYIEYASRCRMIMDCVIDYVPSLTDDTSWSKLYKQYAAIDDDNDVS